ncbi:MAG: hypothetical protein WDN75_17410 [Bacteroidota bacterium]
MESIDEMKNLWEKSRQNDTKEAFDQERVLLLIRARIKKEKTTIGQYMLASWVWQFTLYALLVNMIIRFWGDWKSVLACLAGIGVYSQFTVKYARFCSKSMKAAGKRTTNVEVFA